MSKPFEISLFGYNTFSKSIKDGKATVYMDEYLNTALLVEQFNNGLVKIQPNNSNAIIEISENQIRIMKKK